MSAAPFGFAPFGGFPPAGVDAVLGSAPQQNTGFGSTPPQSGLGGFGGFVPATKKSTGFGGKAPKVTKKTASKKAPVTKKAAKKKPQKQAMKASAAAAPAKKVHRWKPGTVAKRDVIRLQKSNEPLIAFAPFRRMLKGIIDDLAKLDLRVPSSTVRGVADAAEAFLVETFNAALLIAKNGKSSTVTCADFRTALLVRGQQDLIEGSGKYHVRHLLDRK